MQRARQECWRKRHHEKYIQNKEHEKQLKTDDEVEQQRRKLKTKKIDPSQIDVLAKRDVAIISGKKRGKHSMRP